MKQVDLTESFSLKNVNHIWDKAHSILRCLKSLCKLLWVYQKLKLQNSLQNIQVVFTETQV